VKNVTGLGTLLQEARAEQGLTINDMVERTRIRRDFLEAMEAGEFDRLPDPAYIKPFLRTYAKALGLDEEQVALEFDALSAPSQEELLSLRERRQSLQRKKRVRSVIRLLLVVAAAAAIGYIIYRSNLI
jgi:cytoskeletal protein RodZ